MNTPEGYLQNAQGHLVPNELVTPIDLARDSLVHEIVAAAQALQEKMIAFKVRAMDDIAAFIQLSAEQYNAKLGGEKGNVTLTSYDGHYRIVRTNADYLTFDERLIAAKTLIDECIHRWAQGSSVEIQALVEHAFQTDKAGKINTARVLGLTRLDIKDPQWRKAMQAIRDSIQISGSRSYVRIYERVGDSDQWRPIVLDIAAL
jgi:hypothetical protein